MLKTDGYKVDHRRHYPTGTEVIYSNGTGRSGRIPGLTGYIAVGFQGVLERLFDIEAAAFFATPREVVVSEYQRFLDGYLGPNTIGTDHIAALHDLGYLPLEVRALKEGTFVPYGVPCFTVENTLPDFFWLTNYFETVLSSELWLAMTSATTARQYRQILDKWAHLTSDTPEFVDWQGHDFSYRGMANSDAAAISGASHLLYFTGTDTIPAIGYLERFYDGEGLIGGSVAATEHSVMCAGGEDGEKETIQRLIDLYPSGIFSCVSDTWNLWKLLNETAPSLKSEIMARDGKLVFRPDSGDPELILCGDPSSEDELVRKGAINILWDHFGGTVNSKGYKVLDSHVGLIYGDSITPARAESISRNLANQGYASTNVVYGIGSFTYQYVTRDTHGFAMKATWALINGEESMLFKKPITDNGGKFSARGRLAVQRDENGRRILVQNLTKEEWDNTPSELELVWKDSVWTRIQTLSEIRELAKAGLYDA
jgi:nicotinamide phosphoribosyltransferase